MYFRIILLYFSLLNRLLLNWRVNYFLSGLLAILNCNYFFILFYFHHSFCYSLLAFNFYWLSSILIFIYFNKLLNLLIFNFFFLNLFLNYWWNNNFNLIYFLINLLWNALIKNLSLSCYLLFYLLLLNNLFITSFIYSCSCFSLSLDLSFLYIIFFY